MRVAIIKPEKDHYYQLIHYGFAKYVGIVLTDYGFLWNFISLENGNCLQNGISFSLPYDARGLEISI